jgi:hypothetical protein
MKIYVAVGKTIERKFFPSKFYLEVIPGFKRQITATKDLSLIESLVNTNSTLQVYSVILCDTIKMHTKQFDSALWKELIRIGAVC